MSDEIELLNAARAAGRELERWQLGGKSDAMTRDVIERLKRAICVVERRAPEGLRRHGHEASDDP